MPIPRNPYIAGNPVGNTNAFVGRQDVLREVLRTLRNAHENAMTLFGQRRIGKTSILLHLLVVLPKNGPYVPVYFDLQDRARKPLEAVLSELAETIARDLDQPTPKLSDNPQEAFRHWLAEALDYLPQDHSLVLLFDEFDTLADPQADQAAESFFPYLRNLLALDPPRLQFLFVLGRNINDLSQIALSLFKGVPNRRVSLLSHEDAEMLIRLSERNGTLRWSDESVATVLELTNGHPALTQALCLEIWERLREEDPDQPPTVRVEDVLAAIDLVLERRENTLSWLWNGLGAAEKVVAAALAQKGDRAVTSDELAMILQNSGVRILIRELRDAPKVLQDWDLLEPADGGYRFRVELLRRWIAREHPLESVQDELDRIEPIAESLYRAGVNSYNAEDIPGAVEFLRQALGYNPNHRRAAELLGRIYIAQGELDEAQPLLERLAEYYPLEARQLLIQVYLERAKNVADATERLEWYEKVLAMAPSNREARKGKRQAEMQRLMPHVRELEGREHFEQALRQVQELLESYPDDAELLDLQARLERKTHLASMYQEALGALESGEHEKAQRLLVDVIQLQPDYREATRYLHLAVSGVDVAAEMQRREEAVETAEELRRQLESERNENARLRRELDTRRRLSNPFQRVLSPPLPTIHVSKAWSVSTLIWLPLLYPTLGAALGRLPLNPSA